LSIARRPTHNLRAEEPSSFHFPWPNQHFTSSKLSNKQALFPCLLSNPNLGIRVNGKHCLAIAARKMDNNLLDWLEWAPGMDLLSWPSARLLS
jgi:hypothetical protein